MNGAPPAVDGEPRARRRNTRADCDDADWSEVRLTVETTNEFYHVLCSAEHLQGQPLVRITRGARGGRRTKEDASDGI